MELLGEVVGNNMSFAVSFPFSYIRLHTLWLVCTVVPYLHSHHKWENGVFAKQPPMLNRILWHRSPRLQESLTPRVHLRIVYLYLQVTQIGFACAFP